MTEPAMERHGMALPQDGLCSVEGVFLLSLCPLF